MASDKTEPKTGLILRIMAISVVTLVLARFGLISYFKQRMDDEVQRKVLTVRSQELDDLRKREQEAFGAAKIPVDKAMQRLAAEGRVPELTPQQSTDDSPLKGWQQMPREVHGFAGDAGAQQGGGVKIVPEDAGAPLHDVADAAAQEEAGAVATDAGAPKKEEKKDDKPKPKHPEEHKQP
jgi:hypothetical protein